MFQYGSMKWTHANIISTDDEVSHIIGIFECGFQCDIFNVELKNNADLSRTQSAIKNIFDNNCIIERAIIQKLFLLGQ